MHVFIYKKRMHGGGEVKLIFTSVIFVCKVIEIIVHPVFHSSVIAFMCEMSWSFSQALFTPVFQAIPFGVSVLMTMETSYSVVIPSSGSRSGLVV